MRIVYHVDPQEPGIRSPFQGRNVATLSQGRLTRDAHRTARLLSVYGPPRTAQHGLFHDGGPKAVEWQMLACHLLLNPLANAII